jgi:aspartate/methionine/tyrosine aminotransferase
MKIKAFELERYFARHEFSAPHLLCASDCEPLALGELLEMADRDALELWKDLRLGYTDSRGHALLRKEIARLYEGVDPSELLTLVPEEGIFIALNCLLAPRDHVVVTFPGYQSLYEITRSLGCQVSFWKPRREGGWRFELADLERELRPQTRLVVVNFPHNPTGASISRDEFRALVEMLEKRDVLIFSDEMYRFLEYRRPERLPAAVEISSRAVSLGGLSKGFALAGLRSGWLATHSRDLLESFSLFRDFTTICSGAPDEILAIMALRSGDRILERNLCIIADNLALLHDFFYRRSAILEWIPPRAGPVAFPALKDGASAACFCSDLLASSGVLLLPGSVYGYGRSHFRIGFGRRSLPAALSLLDAYLNSGAFKEWLQNSTREVSE